MREYLMPILVVASLVLAGCTKAKSPEADFKTSRADARASAEAAVQQK